MTPKDIQLWLNQGTLDLRSATAEAEDAGVDEDETMEARRCLLGTPFFLRQPQGQV